MKIGIDSHSAEREGEGNATYCRGLITGLVNDGNGDDLTLLSGDPTHAFYCGLGGRPPRIVRVPQGGGVARLGFTLSRAAARAGVECLHVQYFAPLAYRGPVVATIHDLAFLHVPESFPRMLRLALRVLVPRTLSRAAHVITISEFSRRDIIARYHLCPDRISVIPLAARDIFRPCPTDETIAVLARYGLRPGFVFTLGRLNRRKNLERLLRATALLAQSSTAPPLLVIAGKPDFGGPPVLQQSEPGRNGAVRLVGLLPEEDLPAFYTGAALFVFPSLFEGFGLPALEAMACGTPVVASSRAAIPEVVGDAGLLIDPEDVEALAMAMGRILRDRSLAEDLGRRGLERSRRYSWGETARRTRRVYHVAVH
jgi:glycosyltransferase involved in cell wall biosynthesis